MADRICVAQIGAPHGVRGEVRLWSFTGSTQTGFRLEPRGSARGFSNHAIGSRQLGLSAERGTIIAVPSADRRALGVLQVSAVGLEADQVPHYDPVPAKRLNT